MRARLLGEYGAIGFDRLYETGGITLSRPEVQQHSAEPVVRLRPVDRQPFADPLLERGAIRRDGGLHPAGTAMGLQGG